MQNEVRWMVRYYKDYGSHRVGDIVKHLNIPSIENFF